jgi:exonuclease III
MSNKRGVILLFHNEFKINKVQLDIKKRYIIADIENPTTNLLIGNVYYPNVIKEAVEFSETFYLRFMELQYENPSAMCVIMGDMNVCFGKEDYLNRVLRVGKDKLSRVIALNKESCELTDSYRILHKSGEFTWNRGN